MKSCRNQTVCHQVDDGVMVPTGPDISNWSGDQAEPSELGYTDLLLSGSKWNQHVSSLHNPPTPTIVAHLFTLMQIIGFQFCFN